MNRIETSETPALNISAVERDTGLSKDTLRVWERRYGFPKPDRDANGERLYPAPQVARLRLLRRLIDLGHRPGRLIGLSGEAIEALAIQAEQRPPDTRAAASPVNLHELLETIRSHRIAELRAALSQWTMKIGLEGLVMQVIAPMNVLVGDCWARGELEVYEEHLYTEAVQAVLRTAITSLPGGQGGPRVLLTTFPGEVHGLGLLMAETLFALDGAQCASLGTQTPIWDIALAANSHQTDIVALSFSACSNINQVGDGLRELRGKLPAQIEIWAGGHGPALRRKLPAGVSVITELSEIRTALAAWRQAR